ncbi:MAG: hypothetical protein QME42_05605 [bacterium]|nr:hypothetical protein [bacterium]
MINVEYKARVLPDGHLSCPENIKKKLHLSNGSEIKVILLNKWSTEFIKEGESSKSRDKLEKIEREKNSFAELSVCGIWADCEDMKNGVDWVNQLRADVNDRQRRLGLE